MLLMVLTFMFSVSMAMVSYEQLSAAVSGAALQDLTNALVVSGRPLRFDPSSGF